MSTEIDPSSSGLSRSLVVDIVASPAAPAIARNALSGLAAGHLGAASHLDALTLLVSEVVTNAVIHVERSTLQQVELSITVTDQRTRVDVRDHGSGFAPPVEPAVEKRECGYGLALVEQAASRWGADRSKDGFSVWFEIDHTIPDA